MAQFINNGDESRGSYSHSWNAPSRTTRLDGNLAGRRVGQGWRSGWPRSVSSSTSSGFVIFIFCFFNDGVYWLTFVPDKTGGNFVCSWQFLVTRAVERKGVANNYGRDKDTKCVKEPCCPKMSSLYPYLNGFIINNLCFSIWKTIVK